MLYPTELRAHTDLPYTTWGQLIRLEVFSKWAPTAARSGPAEPETAVGVLFGFTKDQLRLIHFGGEL